MALRPSRAVNANGTAPLLFGARECRPASCRRSPHVTSRPGRSWRQHRHRRGPVPPTLVRFRRATRVRTPHSHHPCLARPCAPARARCAASRGQHPCVSERPPTPVSVHACAAARATLARATATTSPRSRPPAAQRRGARRAQQTAPRRRPPSRAAPRPGPQGPPRRASRPFPPQPPIAPARRLLLPARLPVHLSEPPFNLGQLASSGGHVAPEERRPARRRRRGRRVRSQAPPARAVLWRARQRLRQPLAASGPGQSRARSRS